MSQLFESFKNLGYEERNSDKTVTSSTQTKSTKNMSSVPFTILKKKNLNEAKFYEFVTAQKSFIVEQGLKFHYAPEDGIKKELDLTTKLLEYAEKRKIPYKAAFNQEKYPNPVNLEETTSLFMLLTHVYYVSYLPYDVVMIVQPTHCNFFKTILEKFTGEKAQNTEQPTALGSHYLHYQTMIVTENADVHSAADKIVNCWGNNIWAPWSFRKVLVQESVAEKFIKLLENRMPKVHEIYQNNLDLVENFEENIKLIKKKGLESIMNETDGRYKSAIVKGMPMEHLIHQFNAPTPIISLDVFRTVKEAVALFKKEGGKLLSIWSENISESLEMSRDVQAVNVFINCNLDGFLAEGGGDAVKIFEWENHPNLVYCKIAKSKIQSIPSNLERKHDESKSWFYKNWFVSVIHEKQKSMETVNNKQDMLFTRPVNDSDLPEWEERTDHLFLYKQKSVVARIGQSFAN